MHQLNQSELQIIKKRYNVIGNDEKLNRALDVALQVASTDLSVLIIGESGVGKEVIPRIIHDNSIRKRGNYFAINCGSIPEGTIDSELFGHEKGAFTGAIGESEGYFGAANKGTLFLDEVGELPLATQARLLRVLETGEYIRVGGQKVMKTDVRIVAATNVNMNKAISEGRFRRDLYYRLNTIPIIMPPLRERGMDILALFRLFNLQMVEKYRTSRIVLTPEAEQLMLKYKWPGNIRQLKNVTEQISILSKDSTVTADDMLQFIPDDPETTELVQVSHSGDKSSGGSSYDSEREVIFQMLIEMRQNIATLRQEVDVLKMQMGGHATGPVAALPAPGFLPPANWHNGAPASTYADDSQVYTAHDDLSSKSQPMDADAEEITSDDLNLDNAEHKNLLKALERCNGNRKKAAELLGISERTLYRRLIRYGIE